MVGLGYVGLPLGCLFAAAGFRVLGVDLKADRVDTINAGRSPITGYEPGLAELVARVTRDGRLTATTDADQLAEADVVSINVETPVGDDHRPRYDALLAACQALKPVMKPGCLVIVESTIAPGTMELVVQPALEGGITGRAGKDFFLGHCPERVMPGRLLANLRTCSRVVGGQTPEVTSTMMMLYKHVVDADLDPADMLTAELVKTGENAFRDVNIAFANEMALICQEIGGDVSIVRRLLNKSPGRQMLVPGAGVGGHCIPKDPWLLLAHTSRSLVESVIGSARRVNDSMPLEVAEMTADCLRQVGIAARGAHTAVLGYAYLEDSDDTRNSPTEALVTQLASMGCCIEIHDPYVPGYRSDVLDVLSGADCAVVMVAHSAYRELSPRSMAGVMRHAALVDGRNVFSPIQLEQAGFCFRSLGLGPKAQRMSQAAGNLMGYPSERSTSR